MQIDFEDQMGTLSAKQIDVIEELLLFAATKEGLPTHAEMSVNFTNNEMIQELNKTYRSLDQPTDVISFALQDPVAGEVEIIGEHLPLILGDIVISIEQTKEQALAYNHSFDRELGFLVIHGFLHLLGYDHLSAEEEMIMFDKQKEILDEFGLER